MSDKPKEGQDAGYWKSNGWKESGGILYNDKTGERVPVTKGGTIGS